MSQIASSVFLVRPHRFGFNTQTAETNAFQNKNNVLPDQAQEVAQLEFDGAVRTLRAAGVHVLVFEDTPQPPKPDAVFPNNWISCHADGTVVLYPMCTPNRRAERRMDIVEGLGKEFLIETVIDWSDYEEGNRFLEGTGSIIFDHQHKRVYACASPRTDRKLFEALAKTLNYEPIFFRAVDEAGVAIYHTNVMMCIGDGVAVVCLEAITDPTERAHVKKQLSQHHTIVEISRQQMSCFAGNMLMVMSATGPTLILSQTAHQSLTISQRDHLEKHATLLPLSIDTIETIGGGSARCMIAEVFLPRIG